MLHYVAYRLKKRPWLNFKAAHVVHRRRCKKKLEVDQGHRNRLATTKGPLR